MEDGALKAPDPSQRVPVPGLLPHSTVSYVPYVRPIRNSEYYDQNPLLTDAVILRVCLWLFLSTQRLTKYIGSVKIPYSVSLGSSWQLGAISSRRPLEFLVSRTRVFQMEIQFTYQA